MCSALTRNQELYGLDESDQLTKVNAHHRSRFHNDEDLHGNEACARDLYSIHQFSALSFHPEDHDNLVLESASPMASFLVAVTTRSKAEQLQVAENATVAILEVDIAKQVTVVFGMD